MKKQRGFTIIELLFILIILLIIFGFCGYGLNFYKLVAETDFEAPYKAEIIRSVGVVIPPVGAIAGLITIEDGPKK